MPLTLIVEHFDDISDWSEIEYNHLAYHCKQYDVQLMITNYPNMILNANCTSESIATLQSQFDVLYLADLDGPSSLDTESFHTTLKCGIVIGGMLGDDPPVDREQTLRAIPGIKCRSMTRLHLPTDVAGISALKIAKESLSTVQLEEQLVFPTEFSISKLEQHSLPFAYFKSSSFKYLLLNSELVTTINKETVVFGKGLKQVIRNG